MNAKTSIRYFMAAAMTGIGILHFAQPEPFVAIVPAMLPEPLLLVYISGACEIAGGLGLLIPKTRVAAAWGLVALYIAVFPANINMAVNHIPMNGEVHTVGAWVRLPFQALFIALAWWMTRPDSKPGVTQKGENLTQ